jgi:microfibrillar-associated protein 1
MSSTSRKPAPRPAKPVGRYWKGKAPKGAAELPSSDEEEDEEDDQGAQEEDDEALVGEQDFLSGAAAAADEDDEEGGAGKAKKMSIALRDVEISKDGRVKVGGKEGGDEEESEGVC